MDTETHSGFADKNHNTMQKLIFCTRTDTCGIVAPRPGKYVTIVYSLSLVFLKIDPDSDS